MPCALLIALVSTTPYMYRTHSIYTHYVRLAPRLRRESRAPLERVETRVHVDCWNYNIV